MAMHSLKKLSEWTPIEADALNFRALNVIASELALGELWRIANLKMAEEAWKLLSVIHEGSSIVKMSKL